LPINLSVRSEVSRGRNSSHIVDHTVFFLLVYPSCSFD
jgi:hypothetical protein